MALKLQFNVQTVVGKMFNQYEEPALPQDIDTALQNY
jgi:hypothetical protein